LTVGKGGALIQIRRDPGKLISQYVVRRGSVLCQKLFGGVQLVSQRSVVYPEGKDRGGLFGQLGIEAMCFSRAPRAGLRSEP